jgi:hypothetical protein
MRQPLILNEGTHFVRGKTTSQKNEEEVAFPVNRWLQAQRKS